VRAIIPALLVSLALACGATKEPLKQKQFDGRPTVEEARAFIADVEQRLHDLRIRNGRASWIAATYIIHDTEQLAAESRMEMMAFVSETAQRATRFDNLELPAETRRKLDVIKLSITQPAPFDAELRTEFARIATEMPSAYGKGKYCPEKGECQDLLQLSEIMARSHDWDELLEAWQGWRTISPPLRKPFQRFVELANQGARDLGYDNVGVLWRAPFDMSPEAFESEVDRLWSQVKPLYDDLHCHVRARLAERYGEERVPAGKPIPAHLLGNMWSQDAANLFSLVAPEPAGARLLDRAMEQKKIEPERMVKTAESIWVSMGLAPLPQTFWERSLLKKPRDREVICHASAWDLDADHDDVRIKMCIRPNEEDLLVIHHELGHVYYDRGYVGQSPLFRDAPNKGFHEGIAELTTLSVTPEQLQRYGLLEKPPAKSLNPLMRKALDKVWFLPFGVLIDKWRWQVFDGRVKPENYNASWWELRQQYQGVTPPVPRSEADFDPCAKYHVAGNYPYMQYFIAMVLEFQFHRGLCRVSGHEGPLHTCSLHGSRAAGERLKTMLALGRSQPWPDALEALTGERQFDATAMLEYFAPLHEWLKQQNQGRTCGW